MLAEILRAKRTAVARRKQSRPLENWRCQLAPSSRDFRAALRKPRNGFIFECKQASPSAGLLRGDYDPQALARDCAPFADAISVLTDEPFFRGSLEHLRAVSRAVSLPVLCKDFIIDPYQVFEARRCGADAVLLILAAVDDAMYSRCAAIAESLQMHVLTEVHSARELRRALDLQANIIGINNRNLDTLEVDLAVTEKLADDVPAGVVKVCESGIHEHAQVRRLAPKVDAFLVGSALMQEPDVGRAASRLVHGRVKICGMKREQDARFAAQHGASHAGIIFAENSPRQVSLVQASELVNAARLSWVGVFVNQERQLVARYARQLELDAVQLHGQEDTDYVRALRRQLPAHTEIWRAFPVGESLPSVPNGPADRVLLDTAMRGRFGGTGKTFDWKLLDDYPARAELVLGGGINPQNIITADALDCWALDINSGVEQRPGLKSEKKLQAIFARLRGEDAHYNLEHSA